MPLIPKSVHEPTKLRLEGYNAFSETTIKVVAKFAKKQASYKTYQDFFKSVKLPEPKLYLNEKGEGVPVVDIAASKKEKGTIVIHLPMANPLDANQLYNVATIVATNPNYRVIAFGNPSGAPFSYKQQNLTFKKRFGIGTLRNLRPLISAEIDYLFKHGISDMHHLGYSFGAHKALVETSYMEPGQVKSLILIDPVAHPRGLKQLIENFKSSFKPLGEYVNRTKLQTYFDARAEAAETKHHDRALMRPINIAIGFMMARLDFIPMLQKTVGQQSNLRVTVAWGSKSELGNDAHFTTTLNQLAHDKPGKLHSVRFDGYKHAFANDVHLYAAIVREGLLKVEQ
jgi:hypothetical protein